MRDVATEIPIFISLPRGVILQDEIIQFLSAYWGRGSFASLLRDVATETLIFLSLPRGSILQDEINTILGLVGQGELPRGLILQDAMIQFKVQ